MSTQGPLDFEIQVEQVGDRCKVVVSESPVGDPPPILIEFPFTRQTVEQIRSVLDLTGAQAAMSPVEREAVARRFGEQLFQAIFNASSDINAAYRSSLERAGTRGLFIKLSLEKAGDLRDAPWELLRDPQRRSYLCLSRQTSVIRYPSQPYIRPPVTVTGPLRVLVMISSPKNLPPIDVEGEWRRLQAATAALQRAGRIVLEKLDDAHLNTLQRQLRGQEYHIFHYIGHGDFDERTQKGVLMLEDRRGEEYAEPITGDSLADELSQESTLSLVLLNSCKSAQSVQGDPFSGVASSVVERGFPAVVAMQFPISDEAAQAFSEEFYRAVAEGFRLGEAVSEARRAIANTLQNSTEWATPVLYARTPGEPLFELRSRSGVQPPHRTPWRVIVGAIAALVALIALGWGANAIFNPPTPTPTPTPTPIPAFADLVIDSIRTSPLEPAPGRPFIVSVRIRNNGDGPSGAFNVAWLPSLSTEPLVQRVERPIPPGATGGVTFTHTYGWWSNYSTAVTLDVDNEVAEANAAGSGERNNFAPYQIVMSQDSFEIDFSQLPGGGVVDRTRALNGDEFAAWGFRIEPVPGSQDTVCVNAHPRLEVDANRVSLTVGLPSTSGVCASVPLALVFDRAVGALEATFVAERAGVYWLIMFSDSAGTQETGRVEVSLSLGQQAVLRVPETNRALIRRVAFVTDGAPLRIDRFAIWPR